jgi:3-hydroxyacyl-[acyl-carrier-protein] dehydratase
VNPPPFAAPLPAVDEVDARRVDGGLLLSIRKDIVVEGPYLAAHFPGRPVYPGVFILETVRQAVAAQLGEVGGAVPDVSAVASLRFTDALRPGQSLRIEATVGAAGPDGAVPVAARCRREDGSDVARLTLEFRYPAADA